MSGTGVDDTFDPPATTTIVDRVREQEVVVDVGGGPAAASTLVRAAEHSRATGVPFRVVHAWQMSASPSGDASAFFSAASAADARALATRWVLETLGTSTVSVRWILEMVEVPAAVMLPPQLSSQPGGTA